MLICMLVVLVQVWGAEDIWSAVCMQTSHGTFAVRTNQPTGSFQSHRNFQKEIWISCNKICLIMLYQIINFLNLFPPPLFLRFSISHLLFPLSFYWSFFFLFIIFFFVFSTSHLPFLFLLSCLPVFWKVFKK